jgi:hypothetical protein
MPGTGWDDPKVIIAIYAAVVSTITLVWNIIVLVNNTKRKMKIKVKFNQSFTRDAINGYSPLTAILSVESTNHGKEEINIKTVTIDFCGKTIPMMGVQADAIACVDPTGKVKLPYLIKKGEIFKDDMGTDGIINAIKEYLKPEDKVRIKLTDTLGKDYFSKKYPYKSIIDHSIFAIEYNKKSKK